MRYDTEINKRKAALVAAYVTKESFFMSAAVAREAGRPVVPSLMPFVGKCCVKTQQITYIGC